MEKAISVMYTCYGRYLSRFRSIPFHIDLLTPVQRRLLLSLHEIAKGPKTVKSAKVIGYLIGSYHPHSDIGSYGALISLYKQGFIETQGNFGSPGLDDSPASSMRYTECKIKSWIETFCFKYIDFVPWDNYEYENEPLMLPSPLPLGLVGDGDIYSGIAFHKCTMPRYKLSDLAKRLKWLLSPETQEIIIYPNLERDGCTVNPDDTVSKQILNTGIGSLTIIPNGKIDGQSLHVLGRVPQTNFNKLREDETIHVKCLSGKTLDVQIKPARKVIDVNTFFNNIYNKYLIKNINFNICVCDEAGKVTTRGVDELLLTCYGYYIEVVKYKLINDCIKEIEKKFENEIILLIRNIIKTNPTIKAIDEIIQILRAKSITPKITTIIETYDFDKNIWVKENKEILDEDIKAVCSNRNIKSLIESNINIQNNDTKIKDIKNQIVNNEITCYKLICDLAAKI
jgi:DNA gyrase/topoisomerase IV subunit A